MATFPTPPQSLSEYSVAANQVRVSTPPSLTSFSFSQFFAADDTRHGEVLLDAVADSASTTVAIAAADVSPAAPSVAGSSLSLHDLVVLKVCLTCAVCGRLLHHQPTAIETCGHCFCYDCINAALENGCVPLASQWPWTLLTAEADAAAVRWAAATQASTPCSTRDVKIVGPAVARTSSPRISTHAPHAVAATCFPHEVELAGEVALLNEGSVADSASVVAGSCPATTTTNGTGKQARRRRLIRQQCPLCLGPAFKWMLVAVPPMAELCKNLCTAYPLLEGALSQLTESIANNPNEPEPKSATTPSTGSTSADAKESRDDDTGASTSEAVKPVDWIATALSSPLACLPAFHAHGRRQRSGSVQGGDEGDEEAERRRRRSNGGPRKEITFADDIRSPAPVELSVCVKPAATSLAPSSTQGNQHVGIPTSSTADAVSELCVHTPQSSADLIPSPDQTITAAGPLHPQEWCVRGGRGDSIHDRVACLAPEQRLTEVPLHQRGIPGQPLAGAQQQHQQFARGAAPLTSSLLSHVSGMAMEAEGVYQGRSPTLAAALAATTNAAARAPHSLETAGIVLLDTASPPSTSSAFFASQLATAGLGLVRDDFGVGETTHLRDSAAPQSLPPYQSIRGPFPCKCTSAAQQCSAELSDCDGGSCTCVHPSDVWDLDEAYVRRNPLTEKCYAALRVGRLRWNTASGRMSGANAEAAPLLCVAGDYPAAPSGEVLNGPSDPSPARKLAVLSPAGCTALVLGVPCVDAAWLSAAAPASWLPYAVTGWCTRTTAGTCSGSQSGAAATRRNAFQECVARACVDVAGSQAVCRASPMGPRPGAWMSATHSCLLPHATHWRLRTPSSTEARSASDASRSSRHRGYYFFVLPDGATAELAALIATAASQRKNQLVKEGVQEEAGPKKARWTTTDAHPQRAWRRLVLASGGAFVELSTSLFQSVVRVASGEEGATVDEADGLLEQREAPDRDRIAAALLHSLDSTSAASPRHWVHVDVAHSLPACAAGHAPVDAVTSCGAPSITADEEVTQVPMHTLFLLYSSTVARTNLQCSLTSSPTPHDAAPQRCTRLLRFQVLLHRIAAGVAAALSPVLPATESAAAAVTCEVRPADWLLENMAEGRPSPGKRTPSPLSTTPSDADEEAVNGGSPLSLPCSHSSDRQVSPDGTTPPAALGEPPLAQRVGALQGFLYTDTP